MNHAGQSSSGQNLAGQNLAGQSFSGRNLAGQNLAGQSFAEQQQADQSEFETSGELNTAAGLIGAKELSDDLRYLDIIVYNVVGCNKKDYINLWERYGTAIEWLKSNFSHSVPCKWVHLTSDNFMKTMDKLRDEWYNEYPADGIVITSDWCQKNADEESEKVEFKFDAVAFKYRAESTTTEVIGVDWNLSKTKYLVPRVNFKTVQLSGTNVSWAHGDNAQNILDKKIGPGAVVEVMKRGEIIPHIEDVVNPCEDVELPSHCPCCGHELVWEGMHLRCPNIECSDSVIQDTLIWCNFVAPYFGLGDLLKLKFLGNLLGEDNISIDSIYKHGMLSDEETSSVQYNDFKKMFNMLFTNKITLVDAIHAINIPRLGDVNATKLAKYPDIVRSLAEGSFSQFSEDQVKNIGQANSQSILENRHKFTRLMNIIDNIDFTPLDDSVETKGKVAITGKLSIKRDDFEKELRDHGYLPASSVTKDTLFLITDDPNSSSSKNKNADKFGVTKISEQEFRSGYLN